MRTSTHMEVLFSCLLAITLGILIIVSLLQYKQQSKSLQNDIEKRSPFQSRRCLIFLSPFARCGQPPQRGCQLPQQQPQPTPLSPLHFTIVTFLGIVLLSNIVGYLLLSLQLFQGLFCTHYFTINASGQKDQFCYQKIANDSGPRSLKHLTKAGEDETNQKYCKYSPLPEKGF